MSATVHTEPESHQARCSECGWHTWPVSNKNWAQGMAEAHDKVCPNPPPPRIGARMSCGCWTFKLAMPGCVVGNPVMCDSHGLTTFQEMNVPEGDA